MNKYDASPHVRKNESASASVHVCDASNYRIKTYHMTNYAAYPALAIGEKLDIFFETTDQVQRLADALNDYLAENSITRTQC